MMYGMEIPEIKDSPGLNVDIAFISAFHTRFVLDAIAGTLAERPKFLQPIEEDYSVGGIDRYIPSKSTSSYSALR